MPVNHKSGRIVVDVEPGFKLALHAALAARGLTLKEWFAHEAELFLADASVAPYERTARAGMVTRVDEGLGEEVGGAR
jgi:hypothetical protein